MNNIRPALMPITVSPVSVADTPSPSPELAPNVIRTPLAANPVETSNTPQSSYAKQELNSVIASDQEEREQFLSDYERSLLTIVYKNPIKLAEVRQKIKADYFLYLPNKIIYTALGELYDNPSVNVIDLDTLHIKCEEYGFSETGVTAQYLLILDQGFSDEANFSYYVDRIQNAYNKYQLKQILQNSLSLVSKNSADLDTNLTCKELADKTTADITKLNLNSLMEEQAINLGDIAEDYVIERSKGEQGIRGLSTGYASLDTALNGLLPGTLTVLAGKAKVGKSALMLNIADALGVPHAQNNGEVVPILFISTEMYTEEDASRLVAMRALIEERKIANGSAYNSAERPLVDLALGQIKNAKIYHKFMPDFNAEEVCSLITYYKLKYNIGLAIFDYIKMETVGSDENKNKREDQILGDITDALKRAAGKLNIPVLAGCQINNRSDKVADSDRIVRYCNALVEFRAKNEEELTEHDPAVYGTHWLVITHSRGGGNRRIPVSFYKPCLKILEAKPVPEEEQTTTVTELLNSLTTPRATAKKNNAHYTMVPEAPQTGETNNE